MASPTHRSRARSASTVATAAGATDAALELLHRLLAGKVVDVTVGDPPLTLAPASMPPVLIGGSPRIFRRVLAHGAGWFPSLLAPEDLAPAVASLREQAAERGLPTPSITIGGHIMLGDDDARSTYDALVRDLVDGHGMSPEVAARTPIRAQSTDELAEDGQGSSASRGGIRS